MTDTLQIIELKKELERVKLLLQEANGDVIRAERIIKKLIPIAQEGTKAFDELGYNNHYILDCNTEIETAKLLIK